VGFLTACDDLNFNISQPALIEASKDTLIANGVDVLTLNFDLHDRPHEDQKVFISTSMGKLFVPPIINIENEGVDSVTLKPNSQDFSVFLRSEIEFSSDSGIITSIINGYLTSRKEIAFKPSCPEELIASLDKDSMALNVNQEKINVEIVTFCEIGTVSDDIRINYFMSDSSVVEIKPKILRTANGVVDCEVIPKKIGETNIRFYSDQLKCDSISSNRIRIKVYEVE
jgi:hypothetical protein